VPIGKTVDASVIARGTPGFSGADLANLVNESALFAARGAKKLVEMEDFEFAKDKVMMGAERRSIVMPEKERLNTAYHESGHAVVGTVLKDIYDPVHKVTIIPRGRALGLTFYLPEEDRYGYDREFLYARIAVALGGRIAEEIFMKQMTTGASSDFESATEMAHNMVSRWGMSDALGTRVYTDSQQNGGLGGNTNSKMSDHTANLIDTEVSKILDDQYARAKKILENNRDKVEVMTRSLMEYETLDAGQIAEIMEGNEPTPPSDLPTPKKKDSSDDSDDRSSVKPQTDKPASDA
ncbi:MAG: ATP-dependent metalloprotease, partial [Arenicella sp.]|nr:ATP-dependent metalloprotease [Arenicella sp.]